MDWVAWHEAYDRPGSPLWQRLQLVQARLRQALSLCPPGPVRLVSACAGKGRDVIEVLRGHPDRQRVRARLIELDAELAAAARASVVAAGLEPAVEVVRADAGAAAAYDGAVPAQIVMMCGVFGNIDDPDISATIDALPQLCAPDGFVIWTRHRRPPDRTGAVRAWLAETGFQEVAFDAPAETAISAGLHRLAVPSQPFDPDRRYFSFTR